MNDPNVFLLRGDASYQGSSSLMMHGFFFAFCHKCSIFGFSACRVTQGTPHLLNIWHKSVWSCQKIQVFSAYHFLHSSNFYQVWCRFCQYLLLMCCLPGGFYQAHPIFVPSIQLLRHQCRLQKCLFACCGDFLFLSGIRNT